MGASSSCSLPSGTTVSIFDAKFCDAVCSLAEKQCVLWDIPWVRLVICGFFLLLAFASKWLLYGLFVLLKFALTAYSRATWWDVARRHTFRWTKRLLMACCIWGAYEFLALPDSVDLVLKHIVKLPFFVSLGFWVNAVFTMLPELISLQLLSNIHPDEQGPSTPSLAHRFTYDDGVPSI